MRTTGKKGKGKWIVIVVIAVFIIAAASNSGNDDTKNESKKVGSVTESSGSTSKDKKKNKSSSKDKKSNKKNSNKKKSNKSSKNNGKTDDNRFHPGDVVEFGDFEIAYMGAEIYKSNNQFIQPKDGYKYVKFYFTFKNTGNSDSYPGSFGCYVNNKKYDQEYLDGSDESFLLQEVSGGREISGSITYEVPKEAKMKDIELEYENNSIWSNKKIIFLGK